MGSVAVLGSLNMDLVARVEQFPDPGETLQGQELHQIPGGKGANQAVAAGKLGADVNMFGMVGNDQFGPLLTESLENAGVDTSSVVKISNSTGVALITVDDTGENQIVIIPGANGKVDKSYVDQVWDEVLDCSVLLLQLEIPYETIKYLVERVSEHPGSKPVLILDPAPARFLGDLPLAGVDYLTPNEKELSGLVKKSSAPPEELLLDQGVTNLIVTRGSNGASLLGKDGRYDLTGVEVDPVDTTAAGDAFNGALAWSLARGVNPRQAMSYANHAGAIATTKSGAQPSLPTVEDVKRLMANNSQSTTRS